jgi:antiviral helicase SLH1
LIEKRPKLCRFIAGMTDSLNAEISLGTVTTVHEAMKWLGYTYLFVRMKKNPFQYGEFSAGL